MARGIHSGAHHGRQRPEAQCMGKIGYANGAMAWRVARRMASKKKGGLAVYRCPHCGKYHIGGHHEAADL